jgi:hypothetical protein
MMSLLHAVLGIVLLFAHGFYLFRGLAMRRGGGKPGTWDYISRTISHFGLPAVIVIGLTLGRRLLPDGYQWLFGIHIVLGILPVILIIAFTPLLSLKRRIPWLLPGANLILFTLAVLTGIIMRFVLQ